MERSATYLIGRLNRITTMELTDALADSGSTISELTVLSVLAARPGGLSNARLARRSLVSPQATHKVVSGLMGRGLVERGPEVNGRSFGIVITDAGRARLAELEPLRRDAEDRVLGVLDPDERAALEDLLAKAARLAPAGRRAG